MRSLLCIALVVCLVPSARLAGESGAKAGRIGGHVLDVAGGAIPKASVFIRRNPPPEEKVELVTHSDAQGDFVLVLPPGAYDVLVASVGFESKVQTILVRSGKTSNIQWVLTTPKDGCDFPGVNCDKF